MPMIYAKKKNRMEEKFLFSKMMPTYLVYWVRNNVGGIVYYLFVFKDGLNFLLRGSPLTNPPLSTSLYKVKKN